MSFSSSIYIKTKPLTQEDKKRIEQQKRQKMYTLYQEIELINSAIQALGKGKSLPKAYIKYRNKIKEIKEAYDGVR